MRQRITTKLNPWLTSSVDTYLKHFGMPHKPVIYEVGSRDGNDGVELAQRIYDGKNLWKDATIVLFECNPPQQKVIETNYPHATLVKEAISDKKDTVDFLQIHGDKNQIGSSSMNLARVKEPWVKQTTTITVQTRRLDDVIEHLGHQNTEIDIMKIDIEHYTWEALEGLGKYLRNVRVFHLETEIEGHTRNKTNLEIFHYMEQKGYQCAALENEWGDTIQDQVWVRTQ